MPAKLAFEFDPFELVGIDPPKKGAAKAREEIASFIEKSILEYVGDGESPIANGSWKRSLSKEYKKKKVAQGGNSYADMILDNDMLLALAVKQKNGGKMEVGVYGAKEAAKADGHNNHSGKSSLPLREFIPKEGQTFKRSIIDGIREIAMEYAANDDTE